MSPGYDRQTNERLCVCLDALEEFVKAIDATGGVRRDDHGYPVPVADEDWIDLGAAYEKACAALERPPLCAAGMLHDEDDGETESDVSIDQQHQA